MALVPFPGSQAGTTARVLPEEDDEAPGGQMSFLEHLDELRKRIVHSLLAVAVGVLVGFAFINRISDFLLGPTRRLLPPGSKMIYTQPGEAFGFNIQIALIAGVVVGGTAAWLKQARWRSAARRLEADMRALRAETDQLKRRHDAGGLGLPPPASMDP